VKKLEKKLKLDFTISQSFAGLFAPMVGLVFRPVFLAHTEQTLSTPSEHKYFLHP
jgi:hypothetical protein